MSSNNPIPKLGEVSGGLSTVFIGASYIFIVLLNIIYAAARIYKHKQNENKNKTEQTYQTNITETLKTITNYRLAYATAVAFVILAFNLSLYKDFSPNIPNWDFLARDKNVTTILFITMIGVFTIQVMIMILVTYLTPEWKTPFSETLGHMALQNLIDENEMNTKLLSVVKEASKDDAEEKGLLYENFGKVFALLPSYENMGENQTMPATEELNKLDKLLNRQEIPKLSELVGMKETIGESVWFMLAGILTAMVTSSFVIDLTD